MLHRLHFDTRRSRCSRREDGGGRRLRETAASAGPGQAGKKDLRVLRTVTGRSCTRHLPQGRGQPGIRGIRSAMWHLQVRAGLPISYAGKTVATRMFSWAFLCEQFQRRARCPGASAPVGQERQRRVGPLPQQRAQQRHLPACASPSAARQRRYPKTACACPSDILIHRGVETRNHRASGHISQARRQEHRLRL